MKTINLINQEKSEIKYIISKYPDGQQQVDITSTIKEEAEHIGLRAEYDDGSMNAFTIIARLTSFKDLELIICTVKTLRRIGIKSIGLEISYFLGARSDRNFYLPPQVSTDGIIRYSNNYLSEVICPIINNLNLDWIMVLDPHSDVLGACLNNFIPKSNKEFIQWVARDICGVVSEKGQNSKYNLMLVSPDNGASKKIERLVKEIGYNQEILQCGKKREEGKVIVDVPYTYNASRNYLIVDDICDGGATFIDLAIKLKTTHNLAVIKMYLATTHGIYSKGTKELAHYFEGIYCTNSYSDIDDPNIKQLKLY